MEYWILTEETLEEVLPKIAADGNYFGRDGKAEPLLHYFQWAMQQAHNFDCELVVYKKDGQWKHLNISRQYNVDWVMQHSEDRL